MSEKIRKQNPLIQSMDQRDSDLMRAQEQVGNVDKENIAATKNKRVRLTYSSQL